MAEDTTPEEQALPQARLDGSDGYLESIINAIAGRLAAGKTTPMDLTTQYISLHKSNPGEDSATAAASELTGGGYARKQVTWGAPVTVEAPGAGIDKGKVTGGALTFDVPAGTITHYGVWNVASGTGSGKATGYMYGKPLSATITLSTAGKVTVTPTHSYGLLD